MTEVRSRSVEEVINSLVPMFIEETHLRTSQIASLIQSLKNMPSQRSEIDHIMREIHSIKGVAASFGFPFVGVICHKLEEYIVKTNFISNREITDMMRFIEEIDRILSKKNDPSDINGFEIFKSLPTPVDLSNFSISPKLVDCLFIGPRDVQFLIIEKQLRACGIRSTNAPRSFQGIELAFRTRPDFIMVSNVIDSISGVEVVHMLRSLNSIRVLPIMFLTNDFDFVSKGAKLTGQLPPEIRIVRKGEHFPDDFADALTASSIL